MTQRDMAGILNITPMTLRNWKKDKTKLYEIVIKGFAFDEFIEKSEKNLEELKKIQKEFELNK
ncbi:hypothetical protein B0F89_11742 [Malaciobacter marinus]|jgi:hypothetical protein|uniref:Uncharacterized protein n=1 Tax=Malaciobacter marinus TaxID=505249 RepID=A0AB36ZU66_9BACT|nr:hypothetical protein [Malaciobacter marinus]PPK60727.1 hypothetical protein B0F89_11742 [Malaciobacter marinus]SKB54087.1 hypothetical protein SAMN06295997_11842 [Malaciobacter marinus]